MPEAVFFLSPRAKLMASLVISMLVIGMYFSEQKSAPGSHDIHLRMAENLPESSPVTIAMRYFAKRTEELSGGRIDVDVYPSGQLGQQSETIEMVRLGVIEMVRTNTVVLANVSKSTGVLTLPYIFEDDKHKYAVLDGSIGDAIRGDLNDVGLHGFEFLETGSRSFYTVPGKEVRELKDLRGLKVRVQPAPIMMRTMTLLGATPTPMNYGEVYSALQTGVVDGAENDYISYESSGHFEVAPYYTEDRHLSPPAILLINYELYSKLSDEYRNIIDLAAHEATMLERDLMKKENQEAKRRLQEKGVVFIDVDTESFREAVRPIYSEFPELSDYIKQIAELKS